MKKNVYPDAPVLLIDDEELFLMSAEFTLHSEGMTNVKTIDDSRQVEVFLRNNPVSAICLDMTMPHISGWDLLPLINRDYPEVPVIVITAVNEVETAVEAMQSGAFDYILKPVDNARLISSLQRALEIRQVREENTMLKQYLLTNKLEHPEEFEFIVTSSPLMRSIFQYIEAIATTPLPVLITGETGTGKELIAQAIHNLSGRKGAFVAENVAGLDDNLFADTLFGHKKGAFTGAEKDRAGLIERAEGGTLFLDEIGDLGIDSQVKLLRLLQEKQFYPLGSDVPKLTDARIVVATLQNLEEMAASNQFRKDLFYRLQAHHIQLPALRERKEDIPVLVAHFMDKAAQEIGKPKPTYPRELLTLLKNYNFPGNIRELEGLIFDAVSRHRSGILSLDTFRDKLQKSTEIPAETSSEPLDSGMQFGEPLPTLKEAESALIDEALQRSDGNQTIAAQMLGLTRRALNNRLQRAKP